MNSIYQQVLGNQFNQLDANVQQFHRVQGIHHLKGRCCIRGAESLTGKLICILLRLPKATAVADLEFELKASEREETWIRHFPQRTMQSRLQAAADGLLGERIGPARLLFSLTVDDGQLSMQLKAIRIFGLPWPKHWFPEVWAIERGEQDRFHFDVGARLRRFGLIVAYSGYLNLPEAESIP